MQILQIRIVLHHTADSELFADDAAARLSAEELEGLVFVDAQRCAHYRATAHLLAAGTGRVYAHAYEVMTFDDGSTLCMQSRTEIDPADSGYGGDVIVLDGTGEYSGARGAGRFGGWSDGHNAFHDVELELEG
jgi:hypothetical protein